MGVGVSHKAPMPGNQNRVPCVGVGVCPSAPMPGDHPLPRSGLGHVDPGGSLPGSLPLVQEASVEAGQPAPVPGGSGVGQGLSAPMPVGHPPSTVRSCEDDEEDVPPNQEYSFLIPAYGCRKGTVLSFVPPALTYSPLRKSNAVNEELGGLRPVGNPAVCVSSRLLVQMEKVCGSMADIASCTGQVLATWAGAASSTEQDVLEFLLALAKTNKDIHRPAEELHCRLLILQRQVVVDSLPCTFSDREKRQLLSSPFMDMLLDSAVVARVQGR
ncbi:hypothetical protein E2C01_045817 [Portunus trituberculatus]|uniref:Uncharacterized protein n=1 Tax=Portunus trituberculatus TaxID=210409 RepID=A0A5B7G308_PORTR|nr:hypothetical protein [Portunus trituberculatus]